MKRGHESDTYAETVTRLDWPSLSARQAIIYSHSHDGAKLVTDLATRMNCGESLARGVVCDVYRAGFEAGQGAGR